MATIVVQDEFKTPKEAILLGDVTITVNDCDGNQYEVHGLTANDLTVKMSDGSTKTLIQHISDVAAGNGISFQTATVTLPDGSTTTVQEMAQNISQIQELIN